MQDKNLKKLQKHVALLSRTLNNLENQYEDKVRELSLLRQLGDMFSYAFDMHEACQKILDIMYDEMLPDNGEIDISSTPDMGTTVTVRLPINTSDVQLSENHTESIKKLPHI